MSDTKSNLTDCWITFGELDESGYHYKTCKNWKIKEAVSLDEGQKWHKEIYDKYTVKPNASIYLTSSDVNQKGDPVPENYLELISTGNHQTWDDKLRSCMECYNSLNENQKRVIREEGYYTGFLLLQAHHTSIMTLYKGFDEMKELARDFFNLLNTKKGN